MSKQKDKEIIIDFMTLNRVQFFNLLSKYKSYLKGKTDKSLYGAALAKVGYAKAFDTTDAEVIAEEYLKVLVEYGIPIYSFEKLIYMTLLNLTHF